MVWNRSSRYSTNRKGWLSFNIRGETSLSLWPGISTGQLFLTHLRLERPCYFMGLRSLE